MLCSVAFDCPGTWGKYQELKSDVQIRDIEPGKTTMRLVLYPYIRLWFRHLMVVDESILDSFNVHALGFEPNNAFVLTLNQ